MPRDFLIDFGILYFILLLLVFRRTTLTRFLLSSDPLKNSQFCINLVLPFFHNRFSKQREISRNCVWELDELIIKSICHISAETVILKQIDVTNKLSYIPSLTVINLKVGLLLDIIFYSAENATFPI